MSTETYPDASDAIALSGILRRETQAIHTQAERSGVVRDLLRGTITRDAYTFYMRNLLPAYQALEDALEHRRSERVVAAFARSELYRTPAIEADLVELSGPHWRESVAIVASAAAYAAQVEAAAAEPSGAALLAHAYVRYFGDLSGGQILRRILARSLQLPDRALSVYDFAAIADLDGFKTSLRHAIDAVGGEAARLLVDEALRGFRSNIAVSEEIHACTAARSTPADDPHAPPG